MSTAAEQELHVRLEGLEQLLQELELAGDPALRARTTEIVQTVLEFHGAALNRILAALAGGSAESRALIGTLARDAIVGPVLSLHGLHPDDVETRVRRALDQVRPQLQSHGGNVELLRVEDDGTVCLRLTGSCHGCPSSQMTLTQTIERAVYDAVPEVTAIRVAGPDAASEPAPPAAFVPLSSLNPKPHERCELCSTPMAAGHRHLLELPTRKLICSCDACALLLGASGDRYRSIPRRTLALADFELQESQWTALEIPIGLTFLRLDSRSGQVVATYPSPAGGLESTVSPAAWQDLVSGNPVLGSLAPDVEALLMHRMGDSREQYLVPIDECYRLIGNIRAHWTGMSGGTVVWQKIAEFFAGLRKVAS